MKKIIIFLVLSIALLSGISQKQAEAKTIGFNTKNSSGFEINTKYAYLSSDKTEIKGIYFINNASSSAKITHMRVTWSDITRNGKLTMIDFDTWAQVIEWMGEANSGEILDIWDATMSPLSNMHISKIGFEMPLRAPIATITAYLEDGRIATGTADLR